jgi:hypothetical protein
VLEPRGQFDLALEAQQRLVRRGEPAVAEQLERDLAPRAELNRPPHRAHAAPPEQRDDAVALDRRRTLRRRRHRERVVRRVERERGRGVRQRRRRRVPRVVRVVGQCGRHGVAVGTHLS